MKKALCFALCALMTLSVFLTGCAKNEPAVPDPTEAAPLATDTPAPTQAPVHKSDLLVAAPEEVEFIAIPEYDGDTFDSDAYDRWLEALGERREAGLDPKTVSEFTLNMCAQLAKAKKDRAEGEDPNLAWSPINVYSALAMLAEVTDGETRAQILSVLGAEDMDSLRAGVRAIFDADHYDDGKTASLLADSLWLNNAFGFNTETLEKLAEVYRASSYWGDPGDPEFEQALKDWINDNTGGLLKDSVESIQIEADTVLAICSTIWFKASWGKLFNEALTEDAEFHIGEEETVSCKLMHKSMTEALYFVGDGYTAVWESIPQAGNGIWYLLPDPGVSVEDLLISGALAPIFDGTAVGDGEYIINLAMPRFDIKSDLDLIPALQELGMVDCFNSALSDFTPLTTDMDGLYVSEVKHSARVMADEDGIEAAAFTIIDVKYGAAPIERETVDFTLDRPFAFLITGVTGAPLFVGMVNNPGV